MHTTLRKKFRMRWKKRSQDHWKKEMIPTKERKRVSRPENKRSRPKITKNKSCIRKTKKVSRSEIRIVSEMNEKRNRKNCSGTYRSRTNFREGVWERDFRKETRKLRSISNVRKKSGKLLNLVTNTTSLKKG